jgi:hypothetical protein
MPRTEFATSRTRRAVPWCRPPAWLMLFWMAAMPASRCALQNTGSCHNRQARGAAKESDATTLVRWNVPDLHLLRPSPELVESNHLRLSILQGIHIVHVASGILYRCLLVVTLHCHCTCTGTLPLFRRRRCSTCRVAADSLRWLLLRRRFSWLLLRRHFWRLVRLVTTCGAFFIRTSSIELSVQTHRDLRCERHSLCVVGILFNINPHATLHVILFMYFLAAFVRRSPKCIRFIRKMQELQCTHRKPTECSRFLPFCVPSRVLKFVLHSFTYCANFLHNSHHCMEHLHSHAVRCNHIFVLLSLFV